MKSKPCIFCDPDKRIILENDLAYAMLDGFPVTQGHTLVIPKRHFSDYFDITKKELSAVHDLLTVRRNQLLAEDKTIEGFNIGINAGQVAGQTIFHLHVHLIPRRKNDTKAHNNNHICYGHMRNILCPRKVYHGKQPNYCI